MAENAPKPDQSSDAGAPDPKPVATPGSGQHAIALLSGARQISVAALREQVAAQFIAETPEEVMRAEPEAALKVRIKEVLDYLLEIAVIRLSRPEKTAIVDAVYSDLLGFGPLDSLLSSPEIREITVDGPDRIFTQIGIADRQPAAVSFEGTDHLEKTIARLLQPTGVSYGEGQPFVEVGRVLIDRRARITVAAPPASPTLTLELRLHPAVRPALSDLITGGMIEPAEAAFLQAHIERRQGMMIVGDVGSGKTTLFQALLPLLPAQTAVVQRAEECDIPSDHTIVNGPDFGTGIVRAAALRPPWLALDEVRFDEGEALLQALHVAGGGDGPQPSAFLWVLRGSTRGERLLATFSMSLRRAQPTLEQSQIVDILMSGFPLVVSMGRTAGMLKVLGLYTWALEADRAVLKPYRA
jgi:pilus assembly protein CpaF